MAEKLINRNKKALFGWTMYDWANSVYALAITTAIFPPYYSAMSNLVKLRTEGNMSIVPFLGFEVPSVSLYSYAISFAYLVIAVLSPLLGAIADYSGSKKKFMMGFCGIGSLSCSLLYMFNENNYSLGVILFVIAAIGYAGGNIFNDAFLPEVSAPEDYAKVSARGFIMGYIGSVIQLIICLVLVLKFTVFGFASSIEATRVSFILVGIWWFGFAQFTFTYLKDSKPEHTVTENVFKKGFGELLKVLEIMKTNHLMKRFLFSFMFYNMGMQTVLYMASLFGKEELHLETPQLIVTVLLIQIIAIGGSQLFALSSKKIGNIPTLLGGIFLWISVCVAAYFITTPVHFYILAACVGMVMGGTQALSRATYSLYIPPTDDNATFFSFYSIVDKISIILGLLTYGVVNQITQNMRTSILFLILFFLIGGVMLLMLQTKAKEIKVLPAENGG